MTREERNARALDTGRLMADLGARATRGGAVMLAAQALRMGLQLVSAAIMARLLTPGDFGLVAMALTVTAFTNLFVDLGLSAATVQRREIDQNTVSALFWINVAMGFGVAALTAGLAPAAAWFFDDPRLLGVVIALAATAPVAAAGAQHMALLQRGMRFLAVSGAQVAGQAVSLAVAVALAAFLDAGYWALVAAAVIGAAVQTALYWRLSDWRPGRVSDWRAPRAALWFGLNLTGFSVMNYFHRQMDVVLLGWRWSDADVGLYTRAQLLQRLPLTAISEPLTNVMVPMLSRLQDEPARYADIYLRTLTALVSFTAALSALLILNAEVVVAILLGPQWSETATILRILCAQMFFSFTMNTMGWLYISSGRTRLMFQWALASTPLIALGFAIGLPYGAQGVAWGYSAIMALLCLPCLWVATRGSAVGFGATLRAAGPPTLIAAGLTLALLDVAGGMDLLRAIELSLSFCAAYLVGVGLWLAVDPTARRRARSLAAMGAAALRRREAAA